MLNYKRMQKGFVIVIGLIIITLPLKLQAQYSTDIINTVHSAVPFMTIAPDSRSGAMGDVGVATSPDINSQHWNPAKYVFMDGEGGASLSYTPWLRSLISDINLAYLVGYKKLDDKQAISGSLRYFSLGNIVFTNIFGTPTITVNPNEFAIDAGYSRLFSDNFSGAMAFRFIRSDLTGGQSVGDYDSKAGISVAADLAFYYTTNVDLGDKDGVLSFGSNISNMGRKISYTEDQDAAFIPTNLRLGGNLAVEIDDYNTFAFSLEFNKLLIPTPPVYDEDSANVIGWGFDPDVSVPMGMIQSFYDAPGGFKEELHEIMIGGGVEYWYRQQFAVRGGYFHEHATKGNRKYFTFGIGLKLNVFELDFAYLVPISATNPLANTLRFTLGFDFEDLRKSNK